MVEEVALALEREKEPGAGAQVVAVDPSGAVHANVGPAGSGGRVSFVGSITKTITAAVLGVLGIRGACSFDDPLGRWIEAPSLWRDVALRELATHRAGLPRAAPDVALWPDYGDDAESAERSTIAATASLSRCGIETPGRFSYSNFGYQLLGIVIERASGRLYLDACRSLLLHPLGLDASLARPGNRTILPGAGRLAMTGDDFSGYLAAVADPPKGVAGDAVRLVTAPDRDAPGSRSTLGWRDRNNVLGHRGRIAGTCAMAAVHRTKRRAIGILADDDALAETIEALAYTAAR